MGPANVVDCVRYDNEDAMRGFSLGGRKAPTESSIQSGRCKVRHYFRRKLRQSPRHEWGVRHRAGIEDNNYSLAACDPTLFSVLTVLEGLVVELRGSVRGRSTAGRYSTRRLKHEFECIDHIFARSNPIRILRRENRGSAR